MPSEWYETCVSAITRQRSKSARLMTALGSQASPIPEVSHGFDQIVRRCGDRGRRGAALIARSFHQFAAEAVRRSFLGRVGLARRRADSGLHSRFASRGVAASHVLAAAVAILLRRLCLR